MMTDRPDNSKKSIWGKAIFLLYGLFVVFTLTIVIYASMQDFHLVERDYYQKELDYQSRIDEIKNTQELSEKPIWVLNQAENILTIKFPDSMVDKIVSGDVLFYKTSDAGSDFKVVVAPDDTGFQFIPLDRLRRGLWKIKLNWQDDKQSYYLEGKFLIE